MINGKKEQTMEKMIVAKFGPRSCREHDLCCLVVVRRCCGTVWFSAFRKSVFVHQQFIYLFIYRDRYFTWFNFLFTCQSLAPVGGLEGSGWRSAPAHHDAAKCFTMAPSCLGSCNPPPRTRSWLHWTVYFWVRVDGWSAEQHVGSLWPFSGDWKAPGGTVGIQTP